MIIFYDYNVSDPQINKGIKRKKLLDYYHLHNENILFVATQLPKYHYVVGEWETPTRSELWEYRE